MKNRKLTVGNWWRWSEYELRDGLIRRAPKARFISYDPWSSWRSARVGSRSSGGSAAPYTRLLEMLKRLEYVDKSDNEDAPVELVDMMAGPLTAESEREILSWCNSYGLLGVVLQRVWQVTLQPQGNTQVQYVRTGFGWKIVEGDVRSSETPYTRPHALLQSLRGGGIKSEPLSQTWSRFFPDVPSDATVVFQYPEPLSAEFWEQYAEPVADFLSAARALREARGIFFRPPGKSVTAEIVERMSPGVAESYQALVEPGGPVVSMGPRGKPDITLVSGTLLSTLTQMMLQDLQVGRLIECPCGNLAVSAAYQARYCSRQCRWRFEQQKYRRGLRKRKLRRGTINPVPSR